MRLFKSFSMIVIGMIAFTAGASTPQLEHKQKAEFVNTFNVEANAVTVENEIKVVSVLTDATIKTEFKVKSFGVKPSVKINAIPDDVGWHSEMIDTIQFYKRITNYDTESNTKRSRNYRYTTS